jgi:hypothetical protein
MEMRTSKHPKPEVANESDVFPHCIISSQASELHQKSGRSECSMIFEVNGGNFGPIIGINRFQFGKTALEAVH